MANVKREEVWVNIDGRRIKVVKEIDPETEAYVDKAIETARIRREIGPPIKKKGSNPGYKLLRYRREEVARGLTPVRTGDKPQTHGKKSHQKVKTK